MDTWLLVFAVHYSHCSLLTACSLLAACCLLLTPLTSIPPTHYRMRIAPRLPRTRRLLWHHSLLRGVFASAPNAKRHCDAHRACADSRTDNYCLTKDKHDVPASGVELETPPSPPTHTRILPVRAIATVPSLPTLSPSYLVHTLPQPSSSLAQPNP